MFKNFLDNFHPNNCLYEKNIQKLILPNLLTNTIETTEFFSQFEGIIFNQGLYRIYKITEINDWTKIVETVFSDFKDTITCFAYDWLGRQFTLYKPLHSSNKSLVLRFDISSGLILKINKSFQDFHNIELVNNCDNILNSINFDEWIKKSQEIFTREQCLGYKIPLFLQGEDEISNLEIDNMKMYWQLFGELLKEIKNTSPGTKISRIIIAE